jgi:hypothetical protein
VGFHLVNSLLFVVMSIVIYSAADVNLWEITIDYQCYKQKLLAEFDQSSCSSPLNTKELL